MKKGGHEGSGNGVGERSLVAAGDRSRVNFALEIDAANETVEVTAAIPALQTYNSTLTPAVTAQSVQGFSLNGRNYINLVQITPGANEGPANGETEHRTCMMCPRLNSIRDRAFYKYLIRRDSI